VPRQSNTLGLLVVGVFLVAMRAPALAQEKPACSGEQCPQPTAAKKELNTFDITLNGFYRFGGDVERGSFGFGALAGIGGHIVPQYAVQLIAGIEIIQRSNTSTLLGLGLRRDAADRSSMVRAALSAYMRLPEDSEYLPGFARRDVHVGLQARVDVLFSVDSGFVGFGCSNVIVDGDVLFSLGVLVAVE